MENLNNEIKGKWVTPLGDFNAQSFPIIEDNKYFITDEELKLLAEHKLIWQEEEYTELEDVLEPVIERTEIDGEIVEREVMKPNGEKKEIIKKHPILAPNPNYEQLCLEREKHAKIKELEGEKADILSWFSANDWKVNKVFIGEWLETDERWTTYLDERALKRARYDEIETELNKLLNNENSEVEEA